MATAGYLESQIDEINSLISIYGDEFTMINEEECSFVILLNFEGDHQASIQFQLPKEYPDSPPICNISVPWIRGDEKCCIENSIQQLAYDGCGSPVIYQITEAVRESIGKMIKKQQQKPTNIKSKTTIVAQETLTKNNEMPKIGDGGLKIFHGDPFTDRKSTFQAHVTEVHSEDDVNAVKAFLMTDNKVAAATHNISAYRIRLVNSAASGVSKLLQSCDDDGENKAGERLLNMMVLMDVENVFVVVSRWFGGIKLGSDRFRHINNAAKDAICKCGWFAMKHDHH